MGSGTPRLNLKGENTFNQTSLARYNLPTLGVGLVLAVAVALGRPPTHLGLLL